MVNARCQEITDKGSYDAFNSKVVRCMDHTSHWTSFGIEPPKTIVFLSQRVRSNSYLSSMFGSTPPFFFLAFAVCNMVLSSPFCKSFRKVVVVFRHVTTNSSQNPPYKYKISWHFCKSFCKTNLRDLCFSPSHRTNQPYHSKP